MIRSLRALAALPRRVADLEAACRDLRHTLDSANRDVDMLAALVGEFTTKPTGRPAKRRASR